MNAISSLVIALVLLTLSDGFFPTIANYCKRTIFQTSGKNKIIILTFDHGYNNQYTNTRPTLDKYEDKRYFIVVCNCIIKTAEQMASSDIVNFAGKGVAQMSWSDLMNLQKEGHTIEAHSMITWV